MGGLIEKGPEVLLKVAEDLPEIKFVFVDNVPMFEQLKRAEKEQKNLYVVGRKTQKEITLYYGAANIVVVPSQYEEGFARVVLGALSSGQPVIASNRGCFPEMISPKVGILIKLRRGNTKKELLSLYQNQEKLKELTKMLGRFKIEKMDYGGGFYELFSMIFPYIFKWIFQKEIPFKHYFGKRREKNISKPI